MADKSSKCKEQSDEQNEFNMCVYKAPKWWDIRSFEIRQIPKRRYPPFLAVFEHALGYARQEGQSTKNRGISSFQNEIVPTKPQQDWDIESVDDGHLIPATIPHFEAYIPALSLSEDDHQKPLASPQLQLQLDGLSSKRRSKLVWTSTQFPDLIF
ncbi:hypothetical protein BDZ45DRAFT_753371 [Acephala macrosclerotiorum]|nr:hypothetical protein BDZ45DRAFT_753371 [Acephala macrosclerotiorum]